METAENLLQRRLTPKSSAAFQFDILRLYDQPQRHGLSCGGNQNTEIEDIFLIFQEFSGLTQSLVSFKLFPHSSE